HLGAELDGVARQLGDVDHGGAGDLVLDLGEPTLDEALALARGMIFGVLREVAVLARLRDRLDDRRALDKLQMLRLFLQPGIALRSHRDLVHANVPSFPERQIRGKTDGSTAASPSRVFRLFRVRTN